MRLRHSQVWSLIACFAAPSAFAAPPGGSEVDLDGVEVQVDAITQASRGLESILGAGAGRLSESAAVSRFQDAVYAHLIGDHAQAAEDFFVLVATRSLDAAGLTSDAEWYLAESLFGMGNADIAESRYLAIVQQRQHTFREDAVRRLLEIYAMDADTSRFEALYEAEVLRGGLQPNDLIRYSIAKSFYGRGEVARARSYFQEIQPGSEFFSRSQYFLAAMRLAEGTPEALAESATAFATLADAETASAEDRAVRDLAVLAVARLHYEAGRVDEAIAAYHRVSDEGPMRADKLHELAWTYIKRGDLREAVGQVDVFLKDYPQHQYAAELNLVRGHLLFELGDLQDSLTAYDRVVAEYVPVRDRFVRLSSAEQAGVDYARAVVALEHGGEGPDEAALPPYAVAVMRADPDLDRALGLFRELGEQERMLGEAEVLLKEVGDSLGSSGEGSGGIQGLRFNVTESFADAAEAWSRLLGAEAQWLLTHPNDVSAPMEALLGRRTTVVADVRALRSAVEAKRPDVEAQRAIVARQAADELALAKRVDAARASLQALGAQAPMEEVSRLSAEVDAMEAEAAVLGDRATAARQAVDAAAAEVTRAVPGILERLETLSVDLGALRPTAGVDVEMDPRVARFDSLLQSLRVAVERLERVDAALVGGTGAGLSRVRDTLRNEADAVQAERVLLVETFADADRVAGTLVRGNFKRLSDLFSESVLGADMGIVNVFWSQVLVTGEQVEAVSARRRTAIDELERRFAFLERKLKR